MDWINKWREEESDVGIGNGQMKGSLRANEGIGHVKGLNKWGEETSKGNWQWKQTNEREGKMKEKGKWRNGLCEGNENMKTINTSHRFWKKNTLSSEIHMGTASSMRVLTGELSNAIQFKHTQGKNEKSNPPQAITQRSDLNVSLTPNPTPSLTQPPALTHNPPINTKHRLYLQRKRFPAAFRWTDGYSYYSSTDETVLLPSARLSRSNKSSKQINNWRSQMEIIVDKKKKEIKFRLTSNYGIQYRCRLGRRGEDCGGNVLFYFY